MKFQNGSLKVLQISDQKAGETDDQKNYRPITCLSTTYKFILSVLTNCTYSFLDENNILPLEQKVCRRGSYDCKDLLLINKLIQENCRKKSRNLSKLGQIIVKPMIHSCILKALVIYKVFLVIVNFFKYSMKLENHTITCRIQIVLKTCTKHNIGSKSNLATDVF